MTPRARRAGISAFLLFIVHSCIPTFRISSGEIDSFFASRKVDVVQAQYQAGGRTFHYVRAGETQKPLVLFIHGSPGSLRDFIHFLADSSLLRSALLITTDRPGFGYSNFGMAEPSLKKQAAMLEPLIVQYGEDRPVILVGHSLGGPLIARMTIDYPDLVDGLIIVAGSMDPDLEPKETWFRAPLATPFLSWILPRAFRASNEEIYQLKPQLQEMAPHLKEVTCPVILIHGKKDRFVPFENIGFTGSALVNASVQYVTIDNMDHFVPWSHPELITEAIMSMLTSLSAAEGEGIYEKTKATPGGRFRN